MAARGKEIITVARNRRAKHDYDIGDTYEAGLQLTGTEVKSLRDGQATIAEGYVQVHGRQAYLVGAYIPEYRYGNINNHAPRRDRKLLLHRHQIDRIAGRLKEQGYTAVPIAIYFKHGKAKLEFGLGKGRKKYDKRHAEREKHAKKAMRDAGW